MVIQTVEEFEKAIYDGFYTSVIVSQPPDIREFFDNMTLDQTMGGIEETSTGPNMWLRNIAGQIQGQLRIGGFLSRKLKRKWLDDRRDKLWKDIRDDLQKTLVRADPVNFGT